MARSKEVRVEGNNRYVLALILIVVGIGGLASQVFKPTTDIGGWIVLIIGVGLLGAFAYTRTYGLLVPGGIMTGLGTGIILSESLTFATDEAASGAIVLGLGLGFLSIWVIGAIVRVAQHHFWPLIPGGILAVVGGALLIGDDAVAVLDYWYVGIIVIGLFVLWRAMVEGRTRA
ncbi:MAG: hypothetical protein OEW24_04545 [Chloroflexota bacterium]|nr:hypothetical protein [Chloroflexota bacterium]